MLVKTADFTNDLPINSKFPSISELLILIIPVKGTPSLFTTTSSAIDLLLRIVTSVCISPEMIFKSPEKFFIDEFSPDKKFKISEIQN